jgi:hypothetical protein
MSISLELRRIREEVKPNKTLDFIFPLIGYSKAELAPLLVNAYLGDVDLYDWDLASPDVFILMRYRGDLNWIKLEKRFEEDKNFKTSYSLYDGRYIMFVFTIASKFINDFNKVLKGKYSELSDPAKILIMRHRSPRSSMSKILVKDKSLKEYWENKIQSPLPNNSEVWPILERKDELFDKRDFKKLMNVVELPV